MKWFIIMSVVVASSGCSLNLTKSQKSDLEQLCQNITIQALNERDAAIKADNERRFQLLDSRMNALERDHRSVEQKVDELLALSHQRMYRSH
jgi:hypothetical protein